jgi:hypothetical protein
MRQWNFIIHRRFLHTLRSELMTKSKPQIKIVNCETGDEIIRDANVDEIAQMAIDTANATATKAEAEAKEIAKSAILDRLGLTADELKTILG